jgi:hypothetical protein
MSSNHLPIEILILSGYRVIHMDIADNYEETKYYKYRI